VSGRGAPGDPGMATIGEALRQAGVSLGGTEARALMRCALRRDAAYLIAHAGKALDSRQQQAYEALVRRRADGEPLAYLTGEREFYSLPFRVTPAVLIPRPETELLVELALQRIPAGRDCRVLELATGSGCVAVAIAMQRPRARVLATELAPEALALARENAARHRAGNIEFVASDWFEALGAARFEVIVANPPYVAEGDPHLAQGDLRHEPRAALVAGADGLECIRTIVAGAGAHLAPGGWLLFEHSHDQAPRCRALLVAAGFGQVLTERDLAGIERVSGGRRGG